MNYNELNQWREFANDPETPAKLRTIIYDFFIPYKISFIKCSINFDAISDPFRYIMYQDEPLFSKTLKCFQEDPSLKAMGYPDWFYSAFPDVAMWAIKGAGLSIIKQSFKNLSEDELIYNNSLRNEHLKFIVDLYISRTGNKLEVGIDNQSESFFDSHCVT